MVMKVNFIDVFLKLTEKVELKDSNKYQKSIK